MVVLLHTPRPPRGNRRIRMTGENSGGAEAQATTPNEGAAFDWAEIDLSRHARLVGQAQLLVELVKGCAGELDQVLRDLTAATTAAGLTFRYDREPDALSWALELTGPGFQASGTVAVALASANCVSISARPNGDQPLLRYEVTLGRIEDFAAHLSADFRTAVVSSVLDATPVITT